MTERELRRASDGTLVVAVGRWHPEALAETYRRHGGSVYALAQRLLRNPSLAEEVTQEVFLRLWDRPERFDVNRGSLRSFLLADTHGRSVDLIRAEGARRGREERQAKLAPEGGPGRRGRGVVAGCLGSGARGAGGPQRR